MQILHSGCACGRDHRANIDQILIGSGVLEKLPEIVRKYGSRPFLLADCNTWKAAGEQVAELLRKDGIPFFKHVFRDSALEPDEKAVGSAVMHFDPACDVIVGIGSGVINDIGKILSHISGRSYVIVATAPSMDGYASATSSMSRDGLKVSVNSRCADVILGDTRILREAPLEMLRSGIGDMLAKYVSIAEWRIAHLITGEYYCPEVARMIRSAVKDCAENADALMERQEAAVEAVFRGLVAGGVAMAYAGVSRPASGVEHYFSHVWDMRGLAFGTPTQTHGIQCATATALAVRLYEKLATMTPDERKAKEFVEAFSWEEWKNRLRAFLGSGAQAMIALEEKEGKYRKETHGERFRIIKDHWQEILQILREELPEEQELLRLLDTLGIPRDPAAFGIDRETLRETFRMTKDIRDKYVLSRLAWDLGVVEELCELL